MKIRHRNVNQIKAGVILSYSSMLLKYVIAIAYTPIMLRLLGQSEYGLYTLVASVVSYLGLLSFGFSSAYMRYYSRYKVAGDTEKIAKLNGMFIIIYSVIGVIMLLAGAGLVLNTQLVFGAKLTAVETEKAKILLAIMVFNLAALFPASVFDSHITANEKFVFQKVMLIIRQVVSPLLMLPVLLIGFKSVGMVVVTTVIHIILMIWNMVYCLKSLKMKFNFSKFDFSLMKEMTVFSSYIFINIVVDQINWNVGKFILARFCGTTVVAIYGIAGLLNSNYLSLSAVIAGVFTPRINRMVAADKGNKELTDLFTRVGRIQFIALSLICSGIVMFGRPFIFLWAGPGYVSAYPMVLLLIIPVTVPLIQNLGIEIQRAKNMHKFRSWAYIFISLGNVAVSIPLAKRYGGVGAAAGTAFALIIGNGFAMNWYNHKKVGLDMLYFWAQILRFTPGFVAPILFGLLLNHFFDLYHIFPLITGIAAYSGIYAVSMWFLGMNRYEKDLFGKPIYKVIKKIF